MKTMDKYLKHFDEIKAALYSTALFLNINLEIVQILMILMALDTVFGIIKALRLGDQFNFGILFWGFSTKLLILIIPMVLALVGKGLGYDFTPLVDGVMKVLVLAEGFSIFTSMYVIKTKEKVKNVDVVSMLLSSIRKGFMSTINVLLKKIEKPIE